SDLTSSGMVLADRPTTSRWTPHRANAPIRSGRSSKARTEADTSSARHPRRSQSHSESDLGSPSTLREPSPTPGNQIHHRDRIRLPAPHPRRERFGDKRYSRSKSELAHRWQQSRTPELRSVA